MDESSPVVELVPKFLNICITDAYDENAEYLVRQYEREMSRYYTNGNIPDDEWQDMKDDLQFFTVFVKGEDNDGGKFCVCAFLLADESGVVGTDYSTHTSDVEFDYFEDDIVKIVQSPRMHRQPFNFAVCFDDYGQWKRFVEMPSPVNASKDQSKLKEWYNYGEPWNSNPLKPMVAESTGSEGSGWFDENGDMCKTLPGACIKDCSEQGRTDDAVDYWTRELGFDVDFPVDRAASYLHEYGAWDDLDLLAEVASTGDIRKMRQWFRDQGNEMDDTEYFNAKLAATRVLAQRVLWIFCNDLKEQAYDMVGEDDELAEQLGDDPSAWEDREW